MRVALLIILFFSISGCASKQPLDRATEKTRMESSLTAGDLERKIDSLRSIGTMDAMKESINLSKEWAKKLDRERRVNENWSVDCTVDQVTTLKRNFASTFGQLMAYNGSAYGGNHIPFQVYFLGESGPFVSVGFHTYPGRYPTVRVDDNDPIRVQNDGGVSAPKPDSILVALMCTGKVARARYHSWPDGSQDMIVNLIGFEEAWLRLLERKRQP